MEKIMVFINTRSFSEMEKCFCENLETNVKELEYIFSKANLMSKKDGYTDATVIDELFTDFVNERLSRVHIDSVLFYHLSRRLNNYNDDEEVLNLKELLTTENTLKIFLQKNNIHFRYEKGRIEIYYNDSLIQLQDTHSIDVNYLKWRLGHTDRVDYCINGFIMFDMLHKNDYTRSLWFGPELIQRLAEYLNFSQLIYDYIENSRFFCYEYCIPISEVIFDKSENLTNDEKRSYLMIGIMKRLYEYFAKNINYMDDDENLIIRLSDNVNLCNSYLVEKIEMTENMIF